MKNRQNWLVSLWASFNQSLCNHNPRLLMRERNTNEDGSISHLLVCKCGKEFPILAELTRASGVFAAIEDRLGNQQKYAALITSAEQYQINHQIEVN